MSVEENLEEDSLEVANDPKVEVIFDPVLKCYYDPVNNSYYELKKWFINNKIQNIFSITIWWAYSYTGEMALNIRSIICRLGSYTNTDS